jgi:hypothetical protein
VHAAGSEPELDRGRVEQYLVARRHRPHEVGVRDRARELVRALDRDLELVRAGPRLAERGHNAASQTDHRWLRGRNMARI